MPKKSNKSKKGSNVQIELEPVEYVPPHCLPEDALVLRTFWNKDESPRDCVPPPTPNADYEFNNNFYKFPQTLPDINELSLPYVREIGVKATIDLLGNFFQCKEYTCNLLQFWFLDVITASLWIAQDDFQFPDELQKVVLSWILYFIDLIRDRSKNITRKQFFKIFKEAILIASEVVEEGCELVPTPNKLLLLLEQAEEESVSWTSSSTESSGSSLEINQEDFEPTNLIELGNEYRRKYILPEAKWKYHKHDLSSAASSSESSATLIELEEEEPKKIMKRRLKDVEFYQPDLEIPVRFLPFKEEETESEGEQSVEEESEKCICKIERIENIAAEEEETSTRGDVLDDVEHVYEVSDKFQIESVAESISTLNDTASLVRLSSEVVDEAEVITKASQEVCLNSILENKLNKKIIKNLAIQKLWEQRIADMDDPRKGWIPSDIQITANVMQEEPNEEEEMDENEMEEEEEEEEIISSEESEGSVDDEWIDAVINQQNERTLDNEDRQVINYAVIRAIIDIIIK